MVKRIFNATCPECSGEFPVNWELRHNGMRLICPFCTHRFLPNEAKSLDERQR